VINVGDAWWKDGEMSDDERKASEALFIW